MKEQLINFETAKLAKEKGFNVETLHFYCKNRTCDYIKTPYKYSFEVNANQETLINGEIDNFGYGITWSAPTQSLLQKWLREVHNIEIYVHKFKPNGAYPKGYYCVSRPLIHYSNEMKDWIFTNFKTYEEALEVGLQEGLKLLSDEFY